MNAIKLRRLTKFYGPSRGIIDLDLTVKEGEIFGFIGPNGAGKSTTIRTMLGLIHPTEGQGQVLGLDIRTCQREICARTGYLPSEVHFYHGMRVRDVLQFSADLRKKDCSKEAERLCRRLQLDPRKRVDQLSFGNKKKVGIVCALQHEPELLILDEPTSGLDPLMQKEFFEIIEEQHQKGKTVFLSSHVLSEIQEHCQWAAIIREGRLVAADRVEDLTRTNAKRISLHGSFSAEGLHGVRDLKTEGEDTSFLYSGDLDKLLQALTRNHVEDLSITEPSLDEIFLHYYTDGGNKP